MESAFRLFSTILAATFGLVSVALAAGSASGPFYRELKPDQFMKRWLVLKSIPVPGQQKPPGDEEQRRVFSRDLLAGSGGETAVHPAAGAQVVIDKKSFTWELTESSEDTVDLRKGSDPAEFAVAYAWAEIQMKKPAKVLLGIGSDDAVKVWLNGRLVHENWTSRAAHADDDIITVQFQAGTNDLLFKVQNTISEWGLACRIMGPDSQAKKLIGDMWNNSSTESLQHLLDLGLDVNSRTRNGLTPWWAARLRGQPEMAEFLAAKGADTHAKMPEPKKLVNAVFETAIKPGGPGAAVAVGHNGKIVFQKGYGLADIEHHIPVTADTKFRIGSISKQFTAVAILKLQEQGKLSVNDKLSKYYPDFPRGNEVTLRHLLTHTSGIHSYTDNTWFMDRVTKPVKPEEVVKEIAKAPFDFDPGKRWSYCNSGFFLLGCIVEKVSGEPYEQFLRKAFFEPLGMRNTGVHHSDQELKQVALGYDGGPKRAVNWDMSWAGGAGALYSTVGDLCRWNEALFHGKVLSAASLEAAFKPVKTSDNQEDNPEAGYGYGWAIDKFRGAPEISHGGGLNGFTSFLLRLPGKNFTVAVAVNGAPMASPQSLAQQTTEVFLGTELQPRPRSIKLSADPLAKLVGRYDYGQAVLIVEQDGTHLYAQLGMQPRFEIFPKSETEFFWKVADAPVKFVKGPDGKIVEAVHQQNGATIHAPRLGELKIVEVDPSTYDILVGKYKLGSENLVAVITKDGKKLYGQIQGQPRVELLPQSATEFGVREVNAQITFIKNGDGKVAKAKVVQAGETVEATRME